MVYSRNQKKIFGSKKINYKDIPIIINNYNRLEMLTKLIHSLENKGYHNLYIIDNQSTYPPLLEYYTRLPYPVYMLNKNVGHLSLWETGIFKQFKDSYYAYTDSDLEILLIVLTILLRNSFYYYKNIPKH